MSVILEQGLIFSLVSLAVYLSSRVIKKDDLSTEGSFGLAGALTAVLLALGLNPLLVLALAFLAGAILGLSTAILHGVLGMNHLMAGLVSSTASFSISLKLASAYKSIEPSESIFALSPYLSHLVLLSLVALFMLLLVSLFLKTELGLIIRASGENPGLLAYLAKSTAFYQALAYALANALTALSGSLFVQWSGFFSISGSIGTLVTGLTSLMLAELLGKKLFLLILAAIAYQAIFALSLAIGLDPVWNNLLKALLIIALVALAPKKNGERHA